jgi:hypothetical protein
MANNYSSQFRHGRVYPGHPRLLMLLVKTWMPGTRPGMTLFIAAHESDQRLTPITPCTGRH